jgi:hypothetical protein
VNASMQYTRHIARLERAYRDAPFGDPRQRGEIALDIEESVRERQGAAEGKGAQPGAPRAAEEEQVSEAKRWGRD